MKFTIITGMSGSGKSQTVKFFEDSGYFCIDNMPPVLIPKFAEMMSSINGKYENAALVVDVRVGDMIEQLLTQVNTLKNNGYNVQLVFMNADDETLVKRYKETRRQHPVKDPGGLLASIRRERVMLKDLYNAADKIVDTSGLPTNALLKKLKAEFLNEQDPHRISVNVMAFGFKYGMPLDADLVFDVRCFPNPFYISELKQKNGHDKEVADYVMSFKEARVFSEKLFDMIDYLLPLYTEEGKASLTIAVGCTGGKHRSITIAEALGVHLKEEGYSVTRIDRDIERG